MYCAPPCRIMATMKELTRGRFCVSECVRARARESDAGVCARKKRHVCSSICLSLSLSPCLSHCLSVSLPACLYISFSLARKFVCALTILVLMACHRDQKFDKWRLVMRILDRFKKCGNRSPVSETHGCMQIVWDRFRNQPRVGLSTWVFCLCLSTAD